MYLLTYLLTYTHRDTHTHVERKQYLRHSLRSLVGDNKRDCLSADISSDPASRSFHSHVDVAVDAN